MPPAPAVVENTFPTYQLLPKMIDLTSNRISAVLSAEDLAATNSDLEKVSQRLSFLVQLTQKEIERMYKISDADKTFVRNCLAEMSGASDITPPYVNAEEISRDLAGAGDLLAILVEVLNPMNHTS
jgi:hypothetical protein